MKNNKLSAMDELRQEKMRLAEECASQEKRLRETLDFAKGNFGSLLLGSVFSSTKSGLSGIMSLFGGGKSSSKVKSKDDEDESSSSGSWLMPMLVSATPLVWEIVQPMLVGMVLDKVKSLFMPSKKKRKKKIFKKKKVSE